MLKISHSIKKHHTGHDVEAKQTEPYIIFTVDNEEFGAEAQKVLELVKYTAPLKMPNNFANVHGMTIFRGKIIPIIDLRMIFGLEPVSYDNNTVTIIVESKIAFGITADRVLDLNFIPVNSIKKVSAFNFGEKTKYLKSVANFGEHLILLLDLDKMIETKLLERQTRLVEEDTQRARPKKSQVEPGQSPSYLIDPKELEDLLNGIAPKAEQKADERLAKELEFSESELLNGSGNEDDHLDIVEAIQSPRLESNQSGLNPGRLDEADADFENSLPHPLIETDPTVLLEETGSAAKNDQLATGLVGPMKLEEILFELEREKESEKEPGGLSDEAIEDILKELETDSQSGLKEASSGNGNQSLTFGQIKVSQEKADE